MTTPARHVTLRDEPRPDDRDAVRRLVASTGFFRNDEVDVAVELVDERLAKGQASGYEFLFAERDGRPIGYACFGPIACTIHSYDLYWIAVDRGRQGGGVGSTLLAHVERTLRADGGRLIVVETSSRADYAPTRAFYERRGYTRAATLPGYYAPGDNLVIYLKDLTDGVLARTAS